MSTDWTAHERRSEIIRILAGRRQEKMLNLAFQLGVSIRTINYDIEKLAVDYPIRTVRGNNGCVELMDDYHTYLNDISDEQQEALLAIIPMVNPQYAKLLRELLLVHGSRRNKSKIEGIKV